MDNERKQLELLDILNLISFYIGVMNYSENMSQSQVQDTVNKAIKVLQEHLMEQDNKIDSMLDLLRSKTIK